MTDKTQRNVADARTNLARALSDVLEERTHIRPARCSLVTDLAVAIGANVGLRGPGLQRLDLAVRLRDIGKFGVPAAVLAKTGPLTDEEWAAICAHPQLGHDLAREVSFLRPVAAIIAAHHERFDGKGYPRGLRGEKIPLEARICAIADAYHSMVTDRPYRDALPTSHARQEIIRNSGTQFDPRAVNAFVEAERALAAGLCEAATTADNPPHHDSAPLLPRLPLGLLPFRFQR